MGLMDWGKAQFLDILEWLDDSNDTLAWRFPMRGQEIQNGGKLVVRESQEAVFINEGQLADVFKPGTHNLTTQNLPILATLKGWKYGFESPFKAEVYFVCTRTFTGYKWGTKNPIMLRDAEFGPVRLRAFGTYGIRISDPATFLRQIAGTDSRFTVDALGDQIRDMVVARFTDVLGQSKIPVLDLAGNQSQLGKFVSDRIAPDFAQFGLEVVALMVENISLPPEVEQAMDKRTSMGVIGNLDAYTKFQAANAIESAANNPTGGGVAGLGMNAAVGFAMANQLSRAMDSGAGASSAGPTVPPPLPAAAQWFVAINSAQAGPFDAATLQQKAQSGEVKRETLVWKPGMAGWLAAGQVVELASLFAAVPPPLPPQG